MVTKLMNRRHFLAGSAWAFLPYNAFSASTPSAVFVSSAKLGEEHLAVGFDEQGHEVFSVPLLHRGHGIASSQKTIAIFGRRPGKYIALIDRQTMTQQWVKPSANRVMSGHGVFSHDGRYLLTTEQNTLNGQGVLTIRDLGARNEVVQEFSNIGIGLHEVKLLYGGTIAAIAVGGILTKGRKKLNLETMNSCLLYLDFASGQILGEYHLGSKYQKLSLRHLDVNFQNQITLVAQDQSNPLSLAPLVFYHSSQENLMPLQITPKVLKAMKGYCGSVTYDVSGHYTAVSCPRGNLVVIFKDHQFMDTIDVLDACGIAKMSHQGQFLVSSGFGDVLKYHSFNQTSSMMNRLFLQIHQWDNHLALS